MDLNVNFPKTVSAYMQSNARHRFILGPFGSGKTVGSLFEVPRRASLQAPSPSGLRKSRWAVIRNTVPELRETTMKSWFDWFPSGSLGYYMSTTKTYHIKQGGMDAEVIFCALDDEADVKKLLGMELTGANLAEYREIPRAIVEALDGRIGRYPRMNEGGPTWVGMWGDSNAPEEGSYWYAKHEGLDPDDLKKKMPTDWAFFIQPPAMIQQFDGSYKLNPRAENLENLPPGYYEALIKDKSDDFIRVNVLVQYGRSKGGKPIHPLFNRDVHVAKHPLLPSRELLLLVSADFGLTPAMVLKQQDMFGRVLTLDEITTFGMGIERAIETRLLPLLRAKYNDYEVQVTGDPSGDASAQTDEASCADIFRRYRRKGLGKVRMAWSNTLTYRMEATDHYLSRLVDRGTPAYLIDPGCAMLIQGLAGSFRWKMFKDGRPSDEIEKNEHSHVCEANEYGDMFFQRGGRSKAEIREPSPFDRLQQPSVNHYATPR